RRPSQLQPAAPGGRGLLMLLFRWIASSLKLKVAAATLITTLIAISLSYAWSAHEQSVSERAAMVSHQQAVAQMLASNLSASVVFNDASSAVTLLKSLRHI